MELPKDHKQTNSSIISPSTAINTSCGNKWPESIFLPSQNGDGQRIRFEQVVVEDSETLVKFLTTQFIPDNPLFRALGCAEELESIPIDKRCEKTGYFLKEKYIKPALASEPNVSFKAVCEVTGEIVGLSLGQMLSIDGPIQIHTMYVRV